MADNCCNSCDDLGVAQGQQGIPGVPGATGITTLLLGAENIFISKDGNDGTGTNRDLTKSFLTITNAIIKALTLTPSATNIINLIVYPGAYVESFTLPSFVNLISAVPPSFMYLDLEGASTNAIIITQFGDAKMPVYVNGIITVNGTNSNVIGINCNTLAIKSTTLNCIFKHIIASTAITCIDALNQTNTFYDVHSPEFLKDSGITSSYFTYITCQHNSFASSTTIAAKTITLCAFNHVNTRNNCFASTSAVAVNAGNISSSKFSDITTGTTSFFSSSNAASGIGGTTDSYYENIITSTQCFGFSTTATAGILGSSAKFINVNGSSNSFCSSTSGTGGTISCDLILCNSTTGYGSSNTGAGGSISTTGRLIDCKGDQIVKGATTRGIIIGEVHNFSTISTGSGLSRVILTGLLRNCRIKSTTAATQAIFVGANGRIESCQLKGGAGAFAIDATGAVTADIRHSDLYGSGFNSANITLATATPYNTDDVNSIF